MGERPNKVLWLQDNRTGHINKVKGFLLALEKVALVETEVWKVEWHLPWLRHVACRLHRTRLALQPERLIKSFPPINDVDLIISAGGVTQWPNVVLSRRMQIPNIYIGAPNHFEEDAFALVLMMDPPHENLPYLKTTVMPSEVTPIVARDCARQYFPDLGGPAWTLVIGGDGEGLKWSRADYLALADQFIEAAQDSGRNFFVSTSRRTPPEVEQALRDKCSERPGFLGGAWTHAPDRGKVPLLALLGAADRIIVTADSISMMSEAVASGVPTLAVYPSKGKPQARHKSQIAVLRSRGQIVEAHLASGSEVLSSIAPPDGWNLASEDQHLEIARLAFQRLGL